MKKVLILIVFLLIISMCLVGCDLLKLPISLTKDKVFTKAGMEITLNNSFDEKEHVSYTAFYDSQKVAVFVLKEEFSFFEDSENMSVSDYIDLVKESNSFEATINEKDGITYYENESKANGKDFTYFGCAFKGPDAFWLFQFACETKNYKDMNSKIIDWAKTIKISTDVVDDGLEDQTKEMVFSVSNLSITLNDKFTEALNADYNAVYESDKVSIFVLKEEFRLFENVENTSSKDYANLIIEGNSIETSVVEKDNLIYFEYEENVDNQDFKYFSYVLKGEDAFWSIQFGSTTKLYNEMNNDIINWIKTIKLSEPTISKVFSNAGLEITLNNSFVKKELVGFSSYFLSNEVEVFIEKDGFGLILNGKDLPLSDYGDSILQNIGNNLSMINKDGINYFEYESDINGFTFTSFSCVFKGETAFWFVRFICLSSDYDDLHSSFVNWAKTIKV